VCSHASGSVIGDSDAAFLRSLVPDSFPCSPDPARWSLGMMDIISLIKQYLLATPAEVTIDAQRERLLQTILAILRTV
jgi:hypothetical protein